MSGTLPKRPAWVAIALQRYVYTYRNRRSSLKTLRSTLSSRQDRHHMHHGYHITHTEIGIARTKSSKKLKAQLSHSQMWVPKQTPNGGRIASAGC